MASYEQITENSPDGAQICRTAADKVAFYGAVPVIQRAYSSAVHATSAASVSADFGATQLAIVREVQKTLVALGIWASA
jgi:hypothetical protein